MLTLAVTLLVVQTPPVVLSRLPPAGGDPAEALIAETIRRPEGKAGAAFARELVEAEGLKPWHPEQPTTTSAATRFAHVARHAGNGREVVVYYDRDAPVQAGGHVCRVRRSRGGFTNEHSAAIRWCAAGFGITLPPPRSPAVDTN